MVSNELKMAVAQNCPGYEPRYSQAMMGLGSSSVSCSNCANYIRGKCVKELFDGIQEKIRVH